MGRRSRIVPGVLTGLRVVAGIAFAAAAKSRQVTGPVLAVPDTTLAVRKGQDRWELERDPATKVTGDLRVGVRIANQDRMIATPVKVQGAEVAAKPAPKKGKALRRFGGSTAAARPLRAASCHPGRGLSA